MLTENENKLFWACVGPTMVKVCPSELVEQVWVGIDQLSSWNKLISH